MSYKAILFASDGNEFVTDYEAETVDAVWAAVDDGDSRWVFYPIPLVIRDNGPARPTQRVVAACEGFSFLEGRTIANAQAFLRATVADREGWTVE